MAETDNINDRHLQQILDLMTVRGEGSRNFATRDHIMQLIDDQLGSLSQDIGQMLYRRLVDTVKNIALHADLSKYLNLDELRNSINNRYRSHPFESRSNPVPYQYYTPVSRNNADSSGPYYPRSRDEAVVVELDASTISRRPDAHVSPLHRYQSQPSSFSREPLTAEEINYALSFVKLQLKNSEKDSTIQSMIQRLFLSVGDIRMHWPRHLDIRDSTYELDMSRN